MPVRFNVSGGVSAGKDTAQESDVRYPKTFHAGKGQKARTGSIKDCAITSVTPGASDQTIKAGTYIASDITIHGDPDLVSANIRGDKSVFGVPGDSNVVDTSGGTATGKGLLKGLIAFVKGKMVAGEIETLGDTSFSPADASAYNDCKIVGSSYNSYVGAFDYSIIGYIAGKIRIHIANLLPKNVRAGVKIGGIGGDIVGTFTGDATAGAADILAGKTAGINGEMKSGTMKKMTDQTSITLTKSDSRKIIVQPASTDGYWVVTNSDNVTRALIRIPTAGYYTANNIIGIPQEYMASAARLTASMLLKGKSAFGINGTGVWKQTTISSMTWVGFGTATATDGPASFVMPGDGVVYYNGISASYNGRNTVVCAIYKNDVEIDNRNIQNYNYVIRSTMVGKSFSAAKGDVIKVDTSMYMPNGYGISMISAVCVYYS